MRKQAGQEGVEYEVLEGYMRLYYPPQTSVMLGHKTNSGVEMRVSTIGPPDGVMAKIRFDDAEFFFLDRECVMGFDDGGPWTMEHRNEDELNEYLAIFGLKHTPIEGKEEFNISVIKEKI